MNIPTISNLTSGFREDDFGNLSTLEHIVGPGSHRYIGTYILLYLCIINQSLCLSEQYRVLSLCLVYKVNCVFFYFGLF